MQVLSRSNVAIALSQESMRLKSAVKTTFRVAARDTTIGDLQVPAGTLVAASLDAVCFSPPAPSPSLCLHAQPPPSDTCLRSVKMHRVVLVHSVHTHATFCEFPNRFVVHTVHHALSRSF
jgi:hypothetical protein